MARSRPRTAQCKTAELQGKESSPECARQLSPARATGSHQPWSPVAPQLPASSSGNRGSRAPGRTPTLLQRSSDEPTLDLPPKTFYFNGITRQRVPPLLAGWANHSRVLDGVTIPGPPAGIPAQAAWAPSLTWDPTRSRLGFASGEPDSRVAQTAPSGTSGTGPRDQAVASDNYTTQGPPRPPCVGGTVGPQFPEGFAPTASDHGLRKLRFLEFTEAHARARTHARTHTLTHSLSLSLRRPESLAPAAPRTTHAKAHSSLGPGRKYVPNSVKARPGRQRD